MPALRLSDQFGLNLDVVPNPRSGLTKHFQSAVAAVTGGFNLSRLTGLDIEDPAITTFQTGLAFSQPAGAGDAEITVQAGVNGTFGVFVPRRAGDPLFEPDDYGENIPVAADERYVSAGIRASAGIAGTIGAGSLAFGFEPGTTFEIVNYRKFSTKPSAPSLLSALTATLADFSIPADVEDLAAVPEGGIVLLNGRGVLRFTTSANLLAIANPLATLSLPGGSGALNVKAGGSVEVSARLEVSCEYQIRVQKLASNRIRLGYYRKRESEAAVGVTLSAGVAAGPGAFDLFPALIGAISSNPETDCAELESAGLSEDQIDAIEGAVKAGIGRKLELAASTELASLRSDEAAFLYEVALDALDARGRDAVRSALRGDVSALEAPGLAPPAGVTAVRSMNSTLRAREHTLRINLLGIYNFISVSKLTLSGAVVYEPMTGDLVITDSATAERIRTATVPLRAVSERLRHILAESFLITAAYRGSKSVAGAPSLKCAHTFFERNASTSRERMGDNLEAGVALGLLSEADVQKLLGTAGEFGPSAVFAETRYDDERATALFLDGGHPRPMEEYETAGREAIQLLVRPGDIDDYRRRPAIDDALWARMKAAGQFNFRALFPGLSGEQVQVVSSDYTVIVWWAQTMSRTAEKLASVRNVVEANPALDWDDARFRALRSGLAEHLRAVARDTKEEFGRPWGLIAMDRISGRKAEATIQITGSRLALMRERPRVLATAPGALADAPPSAR